MHPRQSYIAFNCLYDAGLAFVSTSYAPFLMQLGLQPSEVSFINAIFWLTILLCELPTGLFADRVSRVWSVRIGGLLTGFGSVLYATATGIKTALLCEIVFAIGMSFISGALSAWIKDAMHDAGKDGEYASTITTAAQYRTMATLGAGLLGGFVGLIDFRLAWLICGILKLAAAAIAIWHMRESHHAATTGERQRADEPRQQNPLAASFMLLRTNRELLWIILVAMAFGLVLPFNHFWAPFFTNIVGSTGRTILWVPMHLAMFVAATLVRRAQLTSATERHAISLAVLLSGIGLACIPLANGVISPIIWLIVHEMGRGMFLPTVEIYTQRRIDRAYRATFGSLQSLLSRIGYVAVLVATTWWTAGADWTSGLIGKVWIISGGLLAAIAVISWLFFPGQKREQEEPVTPLSP